MTLRLVLALALLGTGCPTGEPSPIFDCAVDACSSCELLAERLFWDTSTRALCTECQGAPASSNSRCFNFPSGGGTHVVRGCNTDNDCTALSRYCAKGAGQPHNTCVVNDPR